MPPPGSQSDNLTPRLSCSPWSSTLLSAINLDPFPHQLSDAATAGSKQIFSSAVASSDIAGILNLFLDDGFWMDISALTRDLRTLKGRNTIKNLLDNRLAQIDPIDLRLNHEALRAPEIQRLFPDLVLLRLCFEFGTKAGKGTAVCYLVPSGRHICSSLTRNHSTIFLNR
ncbi:hypothetical protein PAXINDRAFT_92243 [Paxillus involutus ATCC 200175]|uniref:Uncharacterized protein n=1 Tax=Paxillus involutus ATCC 200175 TaxID=664439 RepID=A0A0C9TG79_PAXIN|nr:hypothetical protein PAXINDRAFT_92243 [Paxillus involutus ATCC 200175]